MINIEQELWNFLFGFLGEQCMLPEGCTVPLEGVLVYLGTIIVLAAVLNWRNRLRREFEDFLERAESILEQES
jgi:hypothetical protein